MKIAKVYCDNDVLSAFARDDIPSASSSLARIKELSLTGQIQLAVSEVSLKEIGRIPKLEWQQPIKVVYAQHHPVRFVQEQTLLGFHNHGDRHNGAGPSAIKERR